MTRSTIPASAPSCSTVRSLAPRAVGALLLLATLTGCGDRSAIEPPKILYAQEECHECRMIISDERYAAAIIIDDGEGGCRSAVFDDINCMFNHERSNPDERVVMRYVHDCQSLRWLDASRAFYLHSETLETPMASGVACFEASDPARAAHAEHSGTLLDFPSLRDRFGNPAAKHASTPERN